MIIYPNMAFPSALFDKRGAAFGTADLDASPAPGDADLLPASRAAIDVMGPHLGKLALLPVSLAAQGCGQRQIFLIFRVPLGDIFGKNTEIIINQDRQGQPKPDIVSGKQGNNQKHS